MRRPRTRPCTALPDDDPPLARFDHLIVYKFRDDVSDKDKSTHELRLGKPVPASYYVGMPGTVAPTPERKWGDHIRNAPEP